jgi:hypothetical protein
MACLIQRLLARVVVIASFALSAGSISAQNVMHLRIDTVTANPGATVDVRVLYTFTSTHAHKIHDFNARFLFDTSESQLVSYIMAGTASAMITSPADTISSHAGILEVGDGQEIDLTDSVLFKIRMTLDANADTAWIRWDSSWYHGYGLAVFTAGDEEIDSVSLEDGWIRVPQSTKAIIENASSASALPQLYPNPAYDRVMIDASGYTEGETLEVFDVTGKLCFDGSLVLGAWNIPYGFPPGAYEIVLTSAQVSKYVGTLMVAPR